MKGQKKKSEADGHQTLGQAIKSNFSLMDFWAVVKDGSVEILRLNPRCSILRGEPYAELDFVGEPNTRRVEV